MHSRHGAGLLRVPDFSLYTIIFLKTGIPGVLLMLHLWVITRQQRTNTAFHHGKARKRLNKLHLQKPNPFSQLKGDPEKEEVWVVMLTIWDVPTQKTQRNKAFCSNPVLTGPHVQSKCVTKHSRADTSHTIST